MSSPFGLDFSPEPASSPPGVHDLAGERGDIGCLDHLGPMGEWNLPNNAVGQGIYVSPRENAERSRPPL